MVQDGFTTRIRSFRPSRQGGIVAGLMAVILGAGAFRRFYKRGQAGVNDYYAAAAKSMLLSWKNFFFVPFEPGRSTPVSSATDDQGS